MALPSSGEITMNQVNVELGLSGTASISLNDAAVRGLAGVASGTISLYNLYGKSAGLFGTISGLSFSSGGFYSVSYGFGGIAVDSSENIHIVGTSGSNIYVAKITVSGTITWQRSLNIPSVSTTGTSCALDGSGNLYVSGKGSGSQWYMAKFNSSGTLLSLIQGSTVYTGGCVDVLYDYARNRMLWAGGAGSESYGGNDAVVYSTDLGVTATSYVNGSGAGGYYAEDPQRIKMNSTYTRYYHTQIDPYFNLGGTWTAHSVSPGDPNGFSQIISKRMANVHFADVDGDESFIYAAGITNAGNGYIHKHGIVDSNGGLSWAKEFASAPIRAVVLNGGYVYIAGDSGSNGFIAKLDTSGTVIWQRTITSSGGGTSSITNIKVANNKIYAVGLAGGNGLVMVMSTDGPTGAKGSYSINASSVTVSDSTLGLSGRISGGQSIGVSFGVSTNYNNNTAALSLTKN
jgi:hypothetical protein